MADAIFEAFRNRAWPNQFAGQLQIDSLVGGIPTDPRVAESWLRTKLAGNPDDVIRRKVLETMEERGVDAEQATKIVEELRHLNGFKRLRCDNCPSDDLMRRCQEGRHQLYIEGRQLKAAIKEAASVAGATKKIPLKSWGETRKGLLNFIAEHVCVEQSTLPVFQRESEDSDLIACYEPSEINQRFVATWRGTGIQYEEIIHNAVIDFSILTDHPFTEENWAMIWLTGEQQGIGATRSQGYGRYTITKWEQVR
jgi:hypothetical protein